MKFNGPVKEQIDGVEFILNNLNCLLAYQFGLGKTYTSLLASEKILNNSKNTICFILTPRTSTNKFKEEIEKKVKEKYSIITTSNLKIKNESKFFIFNYSRIDLFGKYLKILKDKGYKVFLIVDEIDENIKYIDKLDVYRHKLECVIGIGNPNFTQKSHMELFELINFIDPGYVGSYTDFKKKYLICRTTREEIGNILKNKEEIIGIKNEEELKEKIEKKLLVKKRNYHIDFIYKVGCLDEDDSKYYKKLEKNRKIKDLQRYVNGLEGNIVKKIDILFKTIKTIMEKNESVAIYTEYEDTLEILSKYFKLNKKKIGHKRIREIRGKTSFNKRYEIENTIRKREVLFLTKSGFKNRNLNKTKNLIFFDIPNCTEEILKIIGRLTRIDNKFDKQVIYILEIKDTIDSDKIAFFDKNKKNIESFFFREENN